jgi:LmbE family N-acetylglucosaminyl deacetylase
MKRVLAVVAHPDDEVLGCGGTLALHARRGDDVQVLTLTDGVSSRGSQPDAARRRRAAAARAAETLGVKRMTHRDFPDNALDSIPLLDLVQAVESITQAFRPHVVYTHHAGDLNVDHARTHWAVLTACRPTAGDPLELLAACEVLSSTEWAGASPAAAFSPRLYVDISTVEAQKLDALGCYREEMRDYPHPRSGEAVRALAAYRGATAGYLAAEAYDVVRMRSEGAPH